MKQTELPIHAGLQKLCLRYGSSTVGDHERVAMVNWVMSDPLKARLAGQTLCGQLPLGHLGLLPQCEDDQYGENQSHAHAPGTRKEWKECLCLRDLPLQATHPGRKDPKKKRAS